MRAPLIEYGVSKKWVELVKEIAPEVTRVAVPWDAASTSEIGYLDAIQSVASSFVRRLRQFSRSVAKGISERSIANATVTLSAVATIPTTPVAEPRRYTLVT